ncbi:MAG: HAD family hydrolase [Planctomycetota bacterium]|nr:HAD family hydrolase [Planctomycetota bacterium]
MEIIKADHHRAPFTTIMFDFDGTLSLIREGWPEVMIPLMVEELKKTGTGESEAELARIVEDFVMRLNGRQTIYQMMQLAEEIRKRQGNPEEPLVYKHRYHDRLLQRIEGRLQGLASGAVPQDAWTVPGSHEVLEKLKAKGLKLILASGTDEIYVKREAELLGVAKYFEGRIHGAIDQYTNFSKKIIVDRIVAEEGGSARGLIGFGDGFVEIQEVGLVGGTPIAVASDEARREGVNLWKRDRLVQAGAHIVIGDYRNTDALMAQLGL